MKKLPAIITLLGASVFAAACSPLAPDDPVPPTHASPSPLAPDFAGIDHWINSPALKMSDLRGKVVLVEFWTYSCINCARVAPHVKQWHERYRDQGLVVVGVHTPEYGYEKQLGNVQEAVRQFGITCPVAMDNGYATWNAYGNRFWPALYLIDQEGRIVYQHLGEGEYAQTEAKIRSLLMGRG